MPNDSCCIDCGGQASLVGSARCTVCQVLHCCNGYVDYVPPAPVARFATIVAIEENGSEVPCMTLMQAERFLTVKFGPPNDDGQWPCPDCAACGDCLKSREHRGVAECFLRDYYPGWDGVTAFAVRAE